MSIESIYKIKHIKNFLGHVIGFDYFINGKLVNSVRFINGDMYTLKGE